MTKLVLDEGMQRLVRKVGEVKALYEQGKLDKRASDQFLSSYEHLSKQLKKKGFITPDVKNVVSKVDGSFVAKGGTENLNTRNPNIQKKLTPDEIVSKFGDTNSGKHYGNITKKTAKEFVDIAPFKLQANKLLKAKGKIASTKNIEIIAKKLMTLAAKGAKAGIKRAIKKGASFATGGAMEAFDAESLGPNDPSSYEHMIENPSLSAKQRYIAGKMLEETPEPTPNYAGLRDIEVEPTTDGPTFGSSEVVYPEEDQVRLTALGRKKDEINEEQNRVVQNMVRQAETL